MVNLFYRFCLYVCGWKCIGYLTPEIKKYIVLVAPHTSNWDFLIGVCARPLMGLNKAKYLGKRELFDSVFGFVFRWLGGIPVDRSRKSNLVDQIVDMYKKSDALGIAITPEGTRSYAKEWKTGFYYIALKAGIPLVLCFMDYHAKEVGISAVFYPTGDIDADMKKIKDEYKTKIPKYPEKSSLEHSIPPM